MLSSLSLPRVAGIALATATLAACGSGPSAQLPPATVSTTPEAPTDDYVLVRGVKIPYTVGGIQS